MYDIVAIVPRNTTVADFKLMVRNLLAERFKLTLHLETKEVPGYALEISRNGLKIKESKNPPEPAANSDGKVAGPPMIVDESRFPAPRPGNAIFPGGAGFSATIKVNGMFRATVLNHIDAGYRQIFGAAAGMPVEDYTGLSGIYAFHVEYRPSLPFAATADPAADVDAPGPDLLDAVQTQLGLKPVRKKAARETRVIDHAEKIPTEN